MQRFNNVSKASKIGVIGNLFLLIIKLIVGIITKSRAMMADALNSAGDIISSFMTFIGNKIASIPRDEDHNLGHGKAEYIYSMLISNLMILLSFMIFKDSILSIIYKSKYTFSYFLIIVCILTIITKLSLYIYTKVIYKKHNNLLIKAAYMDHRNYVIPDDIKKVIYDVLSHRLILTYDAKVKGVVIQDVIKSILKEVKEPKIKIWEMVESNTLVY